MSKQKIKLSTARGQELLDGIRNLIKQGKIKTWAYEEYKGIGYFTHTADQWAKKAWLRPSVQSPGLTLDIIGPQGKGVDDITRGIYLGRFAEMGVTHFPDAVGTISIE